MGPTVYIERDGTGAALLGLRLIGEHDEEHWSAPADHDRETDEPGAASSATEAPAAAAAWIRSRLADGRGARIGTLCLDLRGGACSWLDVPSNEDAVVLTAARNAPRGAWGDWPDPPSREAAASFGADGARLDWRASSLQPLAVDAAPRTAGRPLLPKRGGDEAAATAPRRIGVLALSDLPVRLLLDELDARGIAVDRVITLAHAMAAAWDPGASPMDGERDDPLVGRDTSDSAVVLVEPAGRLHWCWSSQGRLLASGSSRVDPEALEPGTERSASIAGRLGTDWLAWSAQLGRCPGRVLCLVPESLGSSDTAGALGRSITSAWPGASVDLLRIEDPIRSTLARLHERSAGGRPQRPVPETAAVRTLESRPGRAHRGLYRWTAAVLCVVAAALVVLGVRLRGAAADARHEAASLIAGQRDRVAEVLPADGDLTYPSLAASSERDRLRAAVPDASAVRPSRPILAAAEEIGFAIASNPDAELDRITILDNIVTVQVSGPDTRSVEFVPSTLESGTSLFDWRPGDIMRRNTTYQTTVTGVWRSGRDGGEGPAS